MILLTWFCSDLCDIHQYYRRHENAGGFYRVSVYFFSKIVCEFIPKRVVPMIPFVLITYFMIGEWLLTTPVHRWDMKQVVPMIPSGQMCYLKRKLIQHQVIWSQWINKHWKCDRKKTVVTRHSYHKWSVFLGGHPSKCPSLIVCAVGVLIYVGSIV